MEKIIFSYSQSQDAWRTKDPNTIPNYFECYKSSDVDALIEQLSEPERKLSAWINAAHELALSCGMPESEQRTTRYLKYIKKKLSEVDQYSQAVKALVEAGNEMVNPTDRATDNILEMYGKIKERTENLRKAIAAVERLMKEENGEKAIR